MAMMNKQRKFSVAKRVKFTAAVRMNARFMGRLFQLGVYADFTCYMRVGMKT